MKSTDKLNSLRRQTTTETGSTQMNTMQPLNEIGGDINENKPNFSTSGYSVIKAGEKISESCTNLGNSLKKLRDSLNINIELEEDEFEDGYGLICDKCQINSITGSCMKCGLYQYGDEYEIKLRRKQ